jgi:hypothetical protein
MRPDYCPKWAERPDHALRFRNARAAMLARMRNLLALAAALAAGCSIMGHHKVEGWPQLEIVEHYVPHAEMRDRCKPYVGWGMEPAACAEFDLARGKCHIWFSADFPPQKFIVDHERLHCAGFDHIGSSNMQRFLAQHLASQGAAGAAAGGTGLSPRP